MRLLWLEIADEWEACMNLILVSHFYTIDKEVQSPSQVVPIFSSKNASFTDLLYDVTHSTRAKDTFHETDGGQVIGSIWSTYSI